MTVLIVEDEVDLRESLADFLRGSGYDVLTAEHGAAALDLLRGAAEKPMLIFLDMMMPVMDGSEFRREQLKDPALAAIPVVLLTGDSQANKQAASEPAGVLTKPVSAARLLAIAKTYG